jgi:putative membrane protein
MPRPRPIAKPIVSGISFHASASRAVRARDVGAVTRSCQHAARMGYLTSESKQALSEAVQAVELASSAEIVVVMRPASTPALAPCSLAGALGGLLALAFLLFSPWAFSFEAMWLDTLVAGLAGAVVCRRFTGLRRLLTPRQLALHGVAQAAKAEFLDRGITETRDRSGVLIYVSQTERRASVIADRGVHAHVEPNAWQSAVEDIKRSVQQHEDGVRLAACVQALAPILQAALPRRADDINELSDAVVST